MPSFELDKTLKNASKEIQPPETVWYAIKRELASQHETQAWWKKIVRMTPMKRVSLATSFAMLLIITSTTLYESKATLSDYDAYMLWMSDSTSVQELATGSGLDVLLYEEELW